MFTFERDDNKLAAVVLVCIGTVVTAIVIGTNWYWAAHVHRQADITLKAMEQGYSQSTVPGYDRPVWVKK
jgi:hypothetical protein